MSLGVDLGLGQPMEHLARSCLIACRLGEKMALDTHERPWLYYVALLGWVGCIADSHQAAAWFGDDIEYRAGVYDLDMKPLPFLGYLLRRAGTGASPFRRFAAGAAILATGARAVQDSLRAHCQVTSTIADRLGLGPGVCDPLQQIFARWDGQGLPKRLGGRDIALVVRLWHIADVAEVHHRRAGTDAAIAVIRARSGGQFDPTLVEAFCRSAGEMFEALPDGSTWDDLIHAEPGLRPQLTESELDSALETLADYSNLKSPYFVGHSRAVADLASRAAERLHLPAGEVRLLRRAALVHDLGRIGVANTIWDKPGPLTRAELERVRLHPYYTARMLSRPAALADIGSIAALAYERLDGSGYPRGVPAAAIPLAGRVLAASDMYQSMREPRAHRPPCPDDRAVRTLRDEVRAGRLDADAVDAVLSASGHRPARPSSPAPCGLTPREIEVLALLARGATNRQIARRLGITPKTAGNHVEHIYAKTGVTTRPAATLFAMRHGLVRV